MKKILLISDMKAGHENVSNGILENLKEYVDIDIIKLHVKMKSNFFKPVLKFVSNSEYLSKKVSLNFIRFFYAFEHIDFSEIDLVISTGGKTSFMNVLLSKIYGINNIYCSSLRGLKPKLFSYIVTINSNDTFLNALKFEITPLKIKFDEKKADIFLKNLNLNKNEKIWSILIGGATKEYRFEEKEIVDMVEAIAKKAQLEKTKIVLSTSRRTENSTENLIEKLAKKYDNIVYTVLYNKNPQKVMGNYLQIASMVFVTEDSGSMITEAIYSQKPVVTLRPKIVKQQKIFKLFIENCTKNRYIYSIEQIEDLDLNTIKFEKYNDKKNEKNFIKIKELL